MLNKIKIYNLSLRGKGFLSDSRCFMKVTALWNISLDMVEGGSDGGLPSKISSMTCVRTCMAVAILET